LKPGICSRRRTLIGPPLDFAAVERNPLLTAEVGAPPLVVVLPA
jgi:hypothetical protein